MFCNRTTGKLCNFEIIPPHQKTKSFDCSLHSCLQYCLSDMAISSTLILGIKLGLLLLIILFINRSLCNDHYNLRWGSEAELFIDTINDNDDLCPSQTDDDIALITPASA